ncbi:hypothetical protein CAOG_00060 [Capsaspora owczarzaki ATCC 30864]|uniref:hypothetical protein n=1 Tax=Capsaspora owczarzaki (strain ATCC 30864) TaxID=595528 RepID=UPI0003523EF3|nr:hypothetical protein CAOG_00060 [Capsaspora owczarzaki ATCC 30864]|eukprot:XP_004364931.2 hypothetical protein CAOG_00060 [Capsaspora owczarzaki ATCC 30864]
MESHASPKTASVPSSGTSPGTSPVGSSKRQAEDPSGGQSKRARTVSGPRPARYGTFETSQVLLEQRASSSSSSQAAPPSVKLPWKNAGLRRHLLEMLSSNPDIEPEVVKALVYEFSFFSCKASALDVAQTRSASLKNKDATHPQGKPLRAVDELLDWIQTWLTKQDSAQIRESLEALLKTLKRRSPSQHGGEYPLVDLQVATKALEANMTNRLNASKNQTEARLEYRSSIASTLPGAGKSRLCSEFVKNIAPKFFKDHQLHGVCLSTMFNFLHPFDSSNDWTIVMGAHHEHALSTRLLSAYFDIETKVFQRNFLQTGSFQAAACLRLVQEFEFELRHGRKPGEGDELPYLAIAIDEINRLLVEPDSALVPPDVKGDAQRRRHLLKQTLMSLKEAAAAGQRFFVLYAGTIPDQLTSGLTETGHTQPAGVSSLAVDPVPLPPFKSRHIAQFADYVAAKLDRYKDSPQVWRLDASIVHKLRICGGLPRHIEVALGLPFHTAIATPTISIPSLIELVHFCAFTRTDEPQESDKLGWISSGAAFVDDIPSGSSVFQFNLFMRLDLDSPSGSSPDAFGQRLQDCLQKIREGVNHPPSAPDLWERIVVALFNLRVRAFLAKEVKKLATMPSSIDVPLEQVLPGVTFGPGCANLKLRLTPENWRQGGQFMQLAEPCTPGIDSYLEVTVVDSANQLSEAVIGLQMKLHMDLPTTGPVELQTFERDAFNYLEGKYPGKTLFVGIMSTSRFDAPSPAQNAWVLERDKLNDFAQGFQVAVQSAYMFDPHHSSASHIASFLYPSKPQKVCNALARLIVETRASLRPLFTTASQLHQFLIANIGRSRTVSWTSGKNNQERHEFTLQPDDVPSVEQLCWYLALPEDPVAATAGSSSSSSAI